MTRPEKPPTSGVQKGEAAFARKLHGQRETTGRIISQPPSKEYAEGWDRVFGRGKKAKKGG